MVNGIFNAWRMEDIWLDKQRRVDTRPRDVLSCQVTTSRP